MTRALTLFSSLVWLAFAFPALAAEPTRPRLVDAAGKGIPEAVLTFFHLSDDYEDLTLPEQSYASLATDADGRFVFPSPPEPSRVGVRVFQPDYGLAILRLDQAEVRRTLEMDLPLRLSLVPGDSEHGRRAVQGTVVDEEGAPVAGAEVSCATVRTPGQGLINAIHPLHNVLTGKDGTFRLYLPNREPGSRDPVSGDRERTERGKLIPAGSFYNLEVRVPQDLTLFPRQVSVDNTQPAKIQLSRATLPHRFEFEAPVPGLIDQSEQRKWIWLSYRQPVAGEASFRNVLLDRRLVQNGGRLLPGDYAARYTNSRGNRFEWQVLHVGPESPEVLRFKMLPPVVYRGRVVDGATGQPVAGAFVGGYSAVRHPNLALLTPEQWTALEQLPAVPDLADDRLQPLLQLYVVTGLVRTDAAGRFELVQTADHTYHALVTFARDRLPFEIAVSLFQQQLNAGPRVDTADIPLFPAARVRVQPEFDPPPGESLSVWPRWRLMPDDQPEWLAKFQVATDSSQRRKFGYTFYLKLNEPQPVYIPADVRLRIRFECPSNDAWVPRNRDDVFRAARGAEVDFGPLAFDPAVAVRVLVTGPEDQPVEGAPVRRLIADAASVRSWSVVHNCDAQGIAHFHVPRKSSGQFGVRDFLPQSDGSAEVLANFQIEDAAPEAPFRIKLTREQVEMLQRKQ